MKKNILLALLLASLLAACNKAADSSSASASPSINESMEEQAKQTISSVLKDPGSAQFRNIREVSGGVLCGEVNAKNELGGYVGFKRFEWTIISPGFANILSDTDSRCR